MDDKSYAHLADDALKHIETMLEDVAADDVDLERAGDVITLTFRDKKKCVINTQRPTRQLWLAANARAWHFDYDPASKTWRDDKGTGIELFQQIAAIVKASAGIDLRP